MRLVAGLFALTLSTSIAVADEVPRAHVGLRVVRILSDSHQALLYDKQRGVHVLVDEGGEVAGYKVQAIEDGEVILAAEGKEVVLAAPEPRRRKSPAKAAKPAAPEPSIVAPVIIADENGVRTVIDGHGGVAHVEGAAAAADAAATPAPVPKPAPARAAAPPARVAPPPALVPTAAGTAAPVATVTSAATPAAPAPAVDAVTDEAELPAVDPYFVVDPPTVTPYDEVEGEVERPSDPYALPEGTPTVTASSTPYDDPSDDIMIEDDADDVTVQHKPPAPTVIARRDLDAALADFGTLTRSLRGSFLPNGARLEQVARGSVFAKAGLRAGDVVTAVDGRPVRSIDDAAELYVRASTTRATNVQILRAGKPITLKVQIR